MKKQASFDLPALTGAIIRYLPLLMLCGCLILSQTLSPALANDTNGTSANATVPAQTGVSEFSHLIEIKFLADGYVLVEEAVVYSTGTANDIEELVFWVPDNADIMQFQATEMADSTTSGPINYSRNGNFLYFQPHETTGSGGMPLLYGIRYVIQETGEASAFRKVIRDQGTFEYPIARLIVIVDHDEGRVPIISSDEGLSLTADETVHELDYTSFVWTSPQFDELSITLEEQGPDNGSRNGYNSGIIIGILLLVALIRIVVYNKKGSSGDLDELEDSYEAELAVIARIEEDRKKNKLSKEEFESLHKKHTESALKIKSKKEKLKKT